jgi:predicted TIM-barrel fold metal-dependent hydrolase
MLAMTCDIHVHFPQTSRAPGSGGAGPGVRASVAMRLVLGRRAFVDGGSAARADAALTHLGFCMAQSSTGQFVVLALDAPRLEDGSEALTRRYFADNDSVAGFCAGQPRSRFGASVHPYRPDACAELERLARRGACLVKWLPSYQRIDPACSRCIPFYDVLAHFRIPLLSHTGVEHVLPGGDQRLNDPARLALALERGVTVIAAHCGARLMLHEPCRFGQWSRMARAHERLYGDLGAMVLPIRVGILRRILESADLVSKVVHGSDYPSPAWPWAGAARIGFRRARELARLANPLDRSPAALRALGFPEEVFTRASGLLRPGAPLAAPWSPGPLAMRGA